MLFLDTALLRNLGTCFHVNPMHPEVVYEISEAVVYVKLV
jgi:hypothetical protein